MIPEFSSFVRLLKSVSSFPLIPADNAVQVHLVQGSCSQTMSQLELYLMKTFLAFALGVDN
jgi:hypothetical protein